MSQENRSRLFAHCSERTHLSFRACLVSVRSMKVACRWYRFFTSLRVPTYPNSQVAIKKIPGAFEDLIDAKRIVREIRLLRHFNHENVIKIVDLLPPPSLNDFEDVYIISELMETVRFLSVCHMSA